MATPFSNEGQPPEGRPLPYRLRYPFGFRPTAGLAWATVIGLGLLALSYLFETGYWIVYLTESKPAGRADHTVWIPFAATYAGNNLRSPWVLAFVTSTIFLIWLYRSYTNLRPLRSAPVKFSPRGAVGWWFLPIANWFKPFQAVRELWRQSDPEFGPLDAVELGRNRLPIYFSLWWGFWLTSHLIPTALRQLAYFGVGSRTQMALLAGVLAGPLSFGAAVTAILVVRNITTRQGLRAWKIASFPEQIPYQPATMFPPSPPLFDQD
jgi:hypothetical protein